MLGEVRRNAPDVAGGAGRPPAPPVPAGRVRGRLGVEGAPARARRGSCRWRFADVHRALAGRRPLRADDVRRRRARHRSPDPTGRPPRPAVHLVAAGGADRRAGRRRLRRRVDRAGRRRVDDPRIEATATRARTLPDHVGAGMRLLCCGLNPSLHAADAGVGYVTPGNRFWPALRDAGLTDADRDPRRLLAPRPHRHDRPREAGHRPGRRAVRRRSTASASSGSARLCAWLRPQAICVVGLAGWRAAVDRKATVGWQPGDLGGVPVYVLPSTSGLNARIPRDELVDHLRAAAPGPRIPSPVRRLADVDARHRRRRSPSDTQRSRQSTDVRGLGAMLGRWLVARRSSPPSVPPPIPRR